MANLILVKDVIESANKFGKDNILSWNADKFRDNRAKKGKVAFDCTWVNLKFKTVNGDEVPLKLKFNQVILFSSAKLPVNDAKNLKIAFASLTKTDFENTDYLPIKMKSEEEQTKENELKEKKINEYISNTNSFYEALGIINTSFIKIWNDIKATKSLDFNIKKDKSISVDQIKIHEIIQSTYNDETTETISKLETPIAWIKLMLCKEKHFVGVDTWDDNKKAFSFKPNVYDFVKTYKNKFSPVLAKVKKNGKLCDLDKDTAASFITAKSMATGTIVFPDITIFKGGVSLGNSFIELFVMRHKKNTTESSISKNDIMEAFEGITINDHNSDNEVDVDNDNELASNNATIADSDLEDEVNETVISDSDSE
jgi:hypothetical protein